jgi:hypothetical protein
MQLQAERACFDGTILAALAYGKCLHLEKLSADAM